MSVLFNFVALASIIACVYCAWAGRYKVAFAALLLAFLSGVMNSTLNAAPPPSPALDSSTEAPPFRLPTDVLTPSPPAKPEWLQLAVGTKAYTAATHWEVPAKTVSSCATSTQFDEMMNGNAVPGTCPEEPVGDVVVIHRLPSELRYDGGVYVIAKHWSGLAQASVLVPIVPKGTTVLCNARDVDHRYWLRDGTYQPVTDIGLEFRAVVRHTLEPTETLGPALSILSGPGKGRSGYMTFEDMNDGCAIDGLPYAIDFDWMSYEKGD